jgi:hypothetical protein
MKTAAEPNGRLARNPVRELDEYQGELVARLDGAAELGAGTPLGRGQAGAHTSAWRPVTLLSGTPRDCCVLVTVSAPIPMRAMHLACMRA